MAPVGGQRSAFEDGAAGPDQAGDRRDALSQGGRAVRPHPGTHGSRSRAASLTLHFTILAFFESRQNTSKYLVPGRDDISRCAVAASLPQISDLVPYSIVEPISQP